VDGVDWLDCFHQTSHSVNDGSNIWLELVDPFMKCARLALEFGQLSRADLLDVGCGAPVNGYPGARH